MTWHAAATTPALRESSSVFATLSSGIASSYAPATDEPPPPLSACGTAPPSSGFASSEADATDACRGASYAPKRRPPPLELKVGAADGAGASS